MQPEHLFAPIVQANKHTKTRHIKLYLETTSEAWKKNMSIVEVIFQLYQFPEFTGVWIIYYTIRSCEHLCHLGVNWHPKVPLESMCWLYTFFYHTVTMAQATPTQTPPAGPTRHRATDIDDDAQYTPEWW